VKSVDRGWSCPNCGRSNKTAMALDGTAECEYCTDVARVRPFHPWGPKLFSYGARLLSSIGGESGCIQWRLVLAEARAWRGASLSR
jgi:hypothetical protein